MLQTINTIKTYDVRTTVTLQHPAGTEHHAGTYVTFQHPAATKPTCRHPAGRTLRLFRHNAGTKVTVQHPARTKPTCRHSAGKTLRPLPASCQNQSYPPAPCRNQTNLPAPCRKDPKTPSGIMPELTLPSSTLPECRNQTNRCTWGTPPQKHSDSFALIERNFVKSMCSAP